MIDKPYSIMHDHTKWGTFSLGVLGAV